MDVQETVFGRIRRLWRGTVRQFKEYMAGRTGAIAAAARQRVNFIDPGF